MSFQAILQHLPMITKTDWLFTGSGRLPSTLHALIYLILTTGQRSRYYYPLYMERESDAQREWEKIRSATEAASPAPAVCPQAQVLTTLFCSLCCLTHIRAKDKSSLLLQRVTGLIKGVSSFYEKPWWSHNLTSEFNAIKLYIESI